MSLPTRTLVELPRTGIGEALGTGLGRGLEAGIQTSLTDFFAQRKAEADFEQAKSKFKEQSPTLLNRFAANFLTKEEIEALTPEEKRQIQKDAFSNFEQGQDIAGSFESAFLKSEEEREPVTKKRLSKFRGGLLDLIKGTAEKRPVESLIKKKPASLVKAPLAGILEQAELAADIANPINALIRRFSPSPLPKASDLLETGLEQLEPEEQSAFEQLKTAGTFLPDLLLPLLMRGGRGLKTAEKGLEAAEQLIKPVRKVPKKIVPTKVPRIAEVKRIKKVAPSRLFRTAEEVSLREQQVKNFPKFSKEIEQEASKRLDKSLRIKTAATLAKEETRIALGTKQIPELRKIVQTQIGRIRALENELPKLKGIQKINTQNLLKFNELELTKAQEELNKAISLSRTGKVKATTDELRNAAFKRLDTLRDETLSPAKIKLSKRDFNAERIKDFRRLSKQKPIKGKSLQDFHQKVMTTYEDIYTNRLKEIGKEIQTATKARNFEELLSLRKERDSLKKMIENVKAEKFLHDRTLKIRQIEQQKKIARRITKAKPVIKPKITKVATEKIASQTKSFAKNPSTENLSKLSKSSNIEKEVISSAQKQTSDFSKSLKKLSTEFEDLTKTGRFKRLKEAFTEFGKQFQKSPSQALLKTREGRTIALNLANLASEAVFGRSIIPGFKTGLLVLQGRSIPQTTINLMATTISRAIVKPGRRKILQEQLIEALRKKDRKRIIELRKKLTSKERAKAIRKARER